MRRAALLTGVLLAACAASPTRRPNIVLIVADDLGWTDTGFQGSDFYETPNLDRLAREGLAFRQAYANAANCAPARAALLSGQYAPRTGIYTVGSSDRGRARDRRLLTVENRTVLDPSVVTLGELLRDAGYATASIGKWHLGDDPDAGPCAQGFDHNIGGSLRGHPASYHSPYANDELPDGPAGEHLTDRLAAEAAAFVRENAARPFFLYLPFYAVHTPIQPRADLAARFAAKPPGERHTHAEYAALVAGLDEGVGRVLDTLRELGLEEDTLVLFTSDNGGHGRLTTQAPLRGSKGMFYEGGVRVPLFARWPGVVRAGTTSDEPVIGLDLYPTLAALAGAPLPDQAVDGASLVPLLEGGEHLADRALYWHFPAYLEAYGKRDPSPWRTTPVSTLRHGRYKLLEFFEDERLELYDLLLDPGEAHDLASAEPALTERLHAELVRWRTEVGASVPSEPNPRFATRP